MTIYLLIGIITTVSLGIIAGAFLYVRKKDTYVEFEFAPTCEDDKVIELDWNDTPTLNPFEFSPNREENCPSKAIIVGKGHNVKALHASKRKDAPYLFLVYFYKELESSKYTFEFESLKPKNTDYADPKYQKRAFKPEVAIITVWNMVSGKYRLKFIRNQESLSKRIKRIFNNWNDARIERKKIKALRRKFLPKKYH